MKTPAILLAFLLAAGPALADKADDYYRMGMSALQQGKPEVAEAAFRAALKHRPGHAQARYQLGQLPSQAETLKAKRRETEFGKIRLDSVEFDSVPLNEALQALGQMVQAASAKTAGEDKAVTPNFLIQDPKGELGEKEVTLRMKKVPAKVALEYLLQAVGATARYDEHAIVITPAR